MRRTRTGPSGDSSSTHSSVKASMPVTVSSRAMDANDRAAIRHKLIEQRLALRDRLELAADLQEVLRVWLLRRRETTIGAYWPIKGEFDPLPALYRWAED